MLRLIGAAAVIALAASNPVLAQGKGNGHGNGNGNGQNNSGGQETGKGQGGDHASMGHGGNPHDGGRDQGGKGQGGKPAKAERGNAGNDKSAARTLERSNIERGRDVRADDRVRVVERTVVRDRAGEWDRRGDWDGNGDWDGRGPGFASVPGCPPGLAKKNNGCLPPGLANAQRDRYFGYDYRPTLFGVPLRTRADYVYYDGYLVPANRSSGLSYIPLLGGALAVGQMWPQAYPTRQLDEWQRDYYGFDDPRDYRYADNVLYRVDPQTSAIESIVALLTGNDFSVGQRMPAGYDVYNVPGAYQDRYPETDDAMYRYADGRVYEVDPTTMLIQKAIELVL